MIWAHDQGIECKYCNHDIENSPKLTDEKIKELNCVKGFILLVSITIPKKYICRDHNEYFIVTKIIDRHDLIEGCIVSYDYASDSVFLISDNYEELIKILKKKKE